MGAATVTSVKPMADLSGSLDLLAEMCKQRRQLKQAETRLTNQIKAIERRMGDHIAHDDHNHFVPSAAMPLVDARAFIREDIKPREKEIAALVKTLPVWEWAEPIPGLGEISLGAILGETGDLSNYATVSRVWKRMGLAVVDGKRQRRVKGSEEALEHGYSPWRRSVAWVAGDCMIRAGKAKDSDYYVWYAAEKERLREKPWCGKCNPEGVTAPRDHCTDGHIHNAAKRHMEKEFLKDLWVWWTETHGINEEAYEF